MRIQCPKCQLFVPGQDIDLARGLAVCRPCGEVIPLGATPAFAAPEAPAPIAYRAYRPESLDWRETESESAYSLVSAPRRLGAIVLLFFALFWDGFLVVWYSAALSGGFSVFLLFPLLHVGVGVFLTHKAIVGLFNSTNITVNLKEFRMHRGPIPDWGGHIRELLVNVESFSAETVKKGDSTIHRVVTHTRAGRAFPTLVCDDDVGAQFAAARLNEVVGRFRAGQVTGYRSAAYG